MKSQIYPIAFVACIYILYIIISNSLLLHDKTPHWGTISYPEYVVPSEDIPLTIFHTEISPPAQVFVSVVYRDKTGKYIGQHRYVEKKVKISDSGQKNFLLPSYIPETANQIRIKIGLFDISLDVGDSISRLEKRAPSLISSWISLSHSGLPIKKDNLSISYILTKGYRTGSWKEHRGDYSSAGWMITIAYVFCFFCFINFFIKTSFQKSIDKIFWITVGVILFLLSINKQLDLQMLFTDLARTAAREYHVYEIRKPFQLKIISLCASLGLTGMISLFFLLRKSHKSLMVATSGISILFLFLVFRLISQHWLDAVLTQKIWMFSLFDLLELSGIIVVFVSITWYYKSYNVLFVTNRTK